MPLSADTRAAIACQQATLVRALAGLEEVPPGFDARGVQAAADALARKRLRSVAQAWPDLARALGRRFGELFRSFASATPLPRHGGPLADGRGFARWLARRGELPDAGRRQALVVDLHYVSTADGLSPRRWPTVRAAWLPAARRFVLGLSLPWLGVHTLSVPF
jgi:hypothetical protein